MRPGFQTNICKYSIIRDYKSLDDLDKTIEAKRLAINYACFSGVPRDLNNGKDLIVIYDINCKPTFEYRNNYLNYIKKMFNLETFIIGENYCAFESLERRSKNIIILSCIRFLYESFDNGKQADNCDMFIRPLIMSENDVKDNKFLENFCSIYKNNLKDNPKIKYMNTNHFPDPGSIKIKSYDDFVNYNSDYVFKFFE